MKGIKFDQAYSKIILRSKVKDFLALNEPAEIVRLAEAEGHRVLFTSPYHSDLQLIKLVWALVKGNVGRQYTTTTTLEMVFERLME